MTNGEAMSRAQLLHESAMEFADKALASRRRGDEDAARALFQQAFDREKQAALSVAGRRNFEPTRSILFRSAASLALESGNLRDAEKMVCSALSGDPPEEIAEELRDLLERVHFRPNGTP